MLTSSDTSLPEAAASALSDTDLAALAAEYGISESDLAALAEQAGLNGIDPTTLASDLTDYLARQDVQTRIRTQLETLLDPTSLSTGIEDTLQSYIENALQSYVTQMTSELSTQLQSQITGQMQTLTEALATQLPAQLQEGLEIDTDALASAFQIKMSEEEIMELLSAFMNPEESSYAGNLTTLGYADIDSPSQINFYPKDFGSKGRIVTFLDDYNDRMRSSGQEDKMITYTDLVGTMMSSVTQIVDTISYALVAFVAISLVVSSIMIGVITYISVLERRKEIGILRAIGASKRDIRLVFNAETMIIGFVAGVLGIVITVLLSVAANIIVYNRLGIENIAQLPPEAGAILVGISMLLAFISGLFPSSAAARKDPVEALRSE